MMTHSIHFAETDVALQGCVPVLAVLRPHLAAPDIVARVRQQQASGYRLAFLRAHEAVQSVAGFRLFECLAWGHIMYIDDLVTRPESRGQGYGRLLMNWLLEHARAQGCEQMYLDSGFQRHSAHRFYLNAGFRLTTHHFALELAAPAPVKPAPVPDNDEQHAT
jgi:GNAT superfamily N-acetyltransferase